MKKYKKAQFRGEKSKAADLKKNMPKYSLNHIIKERYPSFPDALRDLDDAISLLSLFASFPSHETLDIEPKMIERCQNLILEFLLYLILSKSITKAFFSIKGIYY